MQPWVPETPKDTVVPSPPPPHKSPRGSPSRKAQMVTKPSKTVIPITISPDATPDLKKGLEVSKMYYITDNFQIVIRAAVLWFLAQLFQRQVCLYDRYGIAYTSPDVPACTPVSQKKVNLCKISERWRCRVLCPLWALSGTSHTERFRYLAPSQLQ